MLTNVERIGRKLKCEANKKGGEEIYTNFVNGVLKILHDNYQDYSEERAKWYVVGQMRLADKLIREGFNEKQIMKIVSETSGVSIECVTEVLEESKMEPFPDDVSTTIVKELS